jgi:cytochrome c2
VELELLQFAALEIAQENYHVRVSVVIIFIALLLGACSKQTAAQRDAQERAKPGYLVAKRFCTQCHNLPFGDQHPAAAWPYVVSRMEGHIEAAHKRMPNDAERAAIIGYFQSK